MHWRAIAVKLAREAQAGLEAYWKTLHEQWPIAAGAVVVALLFPGWAETLLGLASLWPVVLGDRPYQLRYLGSRLVLHYVSLHWVFLPVVISYAMLMHVFIAGGGTTAARAHSQRIDYFASRWPTFAGYGLVPALLSLTRLGPAAALVCGLYHDPGSSTKYGVRVPQGPAHVIDFLDLL